MEEAAPEPAAATAAPAESETLTAPLPYAPQWDRATRYLVTVGLVIFGIWVLTLLQPVLTMLVISFIISFLMYRPALFLQTRARLPWPAAVILLFLAIGLALTLAVVLLVPEAVKGFNSFIDTVERRLILEVVRSGSMGIGRGDRMLRV